jgi:hypothetical protein
MAKVKAANKSKKKLLCYLISLYKLMHSVKKKKIGVSFYSLLEIHAVFNMILIRALNCNIYRKPSNEVR